MISSGNLKGTKLFVPEGRMVRPSSGRTRAAIFNTLQHRFDLRDFLIWDAYAGSGSLGLEAFSRGASPIVFTEKNPENLNGRSKYVLTSVSSAPVTGSSQGV